MRRSLHGVTEKENGCEGSREKGHVVQTDFVRAGERAGVKQLFLVVYSFALSPPPVWSELNNAAAQTDTAQRGDIDR